MEHNLDHCRYCTAILIKAFKEGFINNFQLLQTGLVYLPSRKELYELETLQVEVNSCLYCTLSRYLIRTNDGIKGMAVEYWEAWSDMPLETKNKIR